VREESRFQEKCRGRTGERETAVTMHELNCCTTRLLLSAFADLSLVKLSVYLIKHHAVKAGGSGGITPSFLSSALGGGESSA
jgi:hypothetical protein